MFGYNTGDKLTSVIDANNNETVYIYDDHGYVYQVISPDTGTTTYQYDPAGNMISKTDAKGVTINYVYDALNRLTTIDFLSDTDIVYAYDNCPNGKGRLCSMTDASGTTTYEYTPKGQMRKETKTIDSIQYVTQYTYDQNGNLKTMTYPSGRVITYNYTNNRAASVLNNAANLASNITYKPFGGMTGITYGNGLTSSISYDTGYRLATLATGTFQNLTYGYDYNSNITSISSGMTYSYDNFDRLYTANGFWGSLSWSYDGVGNRLTENGNAYTYYPSTNKLNTANGQSFTYDNNGNTITQAARIYSYNQNQRLIQVSDGGMTANYTYNGNGQRVKKVVNGTTMIYHYSLNGQIIAESNNGGTITAEYVYLNGQPLAKLEGANTYYYHNDHLGTPQKVTDASGTIVWAADYKPFGGATITVSTITNNLRFQGQYYDAETGTHYNYSRDYNPPLGKYIQADRVGLLGGINIYHYASSNPIIRTDPFGLWTPSGHENITRDVLGTYGSNFTGPMRNLIVESNILVDQHQLNNSLHYMPGTQSQAEANIASLLERAVNQRLSGDLYESLFALGEALHIAQDRSAHFDQNAGWREHMIGNPDNPDAHPLDYYRAYRYSEDLITRYLDELERRRQSCPN